MKKIFLIFLIICHQQCAFSQKAYIEEKNNIQHIWYQAFYQKFDGEIGFTFDNFIYEDISVYYICSFFPDDKQKHNFPCNCKLTFELFDGSKIELQAVMAEIYPTPDEHGAPRAYFHVTTQQLSYLFNGIRLIKIDLLTFNKKDNNIIKDIPEIKFKKDKFGIYLKQAYEAIESGKKTNKLINFEELMSRYKIN